MLKNCGRALADRAMPSTSLQITFPTRSREISAAKAQISYVEAMSKNPHSPNLTLMEPDGTGKQPRATLGPHGRKLWQKMSASVSSRDEAAKEALRQVCIATDRLAMIEKAIAHDGPTVTGRYGQLCEHPLLRLELSLRAFITRSLARLGEERRPVGRPPSAAVGITWQQLEDDADDDEDDGDG
jgi:hypothetical protein